MPVISMFYGIVIMMYFKDKEVKEFIEQYRDELLGMWNSQKFYELEPLE